MIKKAIEYIKEKHLNIYDLAIMTEEDIEHAYCQPCNACNASYSVTKLFVVTMIGILYDNNLIRLDDKLTDILAEDLVFPYNLVWDQVTIRHALTHSMGIDYPAAALPRHSSSFD